MIALTEKDFENISKNYKTMSPDTLAFYYNKVVDRLKYLEPVLNEIEDKGYNIFDVSKDLSSEVVRSQLALMLLERFIKF